MRDDLVKRLRAAGDWDRYAFGEGADADLCKEAADRIEQLERERIAALPAAPVGVEALKKAVLEAMKADGELTVPDDGQPEDWRYRVRVAKCDTRNSMMAHVVLFFARLSALVPAQPAPDASEWNAAIEAAAEEVTPGRTVTALQRRILALKRGGAA